MPRLSFDVSPDLDNTLEALKEQSNSTSKSEVLRRAIALYKLAVEAKNDDQKIVITDKNNTPKVEVLL